RGRAARLQPQAGSRGARRQHLDDRPSPRAVRAQREDAVGSTADPGRRARTLPPRAPRAPRDSGGRGTAGRPPSLPRHVVDRIRLEYARGRGLADIARALNHDGVPTAHGGRQWWPSTVRTILIRLSLLTSPGASERAA